MNIYKKENSLFIVLITYILTIIFTICITSTIDFNNEWMMILFAHSLATIGIYISSLIFNNSSMYDPFWSVAPIPIIIYLAYFSNNLVLNDLYTSLIVFVVLFWAVRLTHNWTMVWGGLKEEDFRYVDLKQGNLLKKEIVNFFGIHYIPTLQVNVSLLPLYFVFNESVINYNWILIGAGIIFVGLIIMGVGFYIAPLWLWGTIVGIFVILGGLSVTTTGGIITYVSNLIRSLVISVRTPQEALKAYENCGTNEITINQCFDCPQAA